MVFTRISSALKLLGASRGAATVSHQPGQLAPGPRIAGKGFVMKYAGLLVMPAGFFLTVAALALFPDPVRRGAFVFCGLAVIVLGLIVAVRGHMPARGASRI
jgi:hypothetical protein